MSRFLKSLVEFPRVIVLGVLLGTCLAAPCAYFRGFHQDDYIQLLQLEGRSTPFRDRFNIFTFADGVPEHVLHHKNTWPFPWFAPEDFKVRFWRPLAARLLECDRLLFDRNWKGYKAHSLLWYAALIAAFGLLARRLAPGPVGALAVLLFATAYVHAQATEWIAARYANVTAFFGILGLLQHLAWREDGKRRGLWLSLLFFGLALSGGESALGIFGYVGAYELLARREAVTRRLAALLPGVILSAVWLSFYMAAGYGTKGSGSYINPFTEPLQLLSEFPERMLAMTGSQFMAVPGEIWVYMPHLKHWMFAGGAAAILILALVVPRVRATVDARDRKLLTWVGVGMFFAMCPQLCGLLAPRSLLLASIGAALIVAMVLHWAWRQFRDRGPERKSLRGRLALFGCAVLAVVHLGVNPALWFRFAVQDEPVDPITHVHMPRGTVTGIQLVFVVCRNSEMAYFDPFRYAFNDWARPDSWWVLSMAQTSHRMTTISDHAFDLEVLDGRMMDTPVENFFRSPHDPLEVGEVVKLDGMTAEVLAMRGIGPTKVRFTFEKALKDKTLTLVNSSMKLVEIPDIGESTLVE